MSRDRAGRPATHGVRQAAAALGMVKAPSRRQATLDSRTRRAVKRNAKQLKEKPLEAVRKGIEDETSKEQEIVRRGYDFFLSLVPDAADPPAEPVPMETLLGLGKFLAWVGNRLDRHRDQIIELATMQRDKAPRFDEYLRQHSAPPAPAAPEPADSDGASAPEDGE